MRNTFHPAAERLVDLPGLESLRQQVPLDALQRAAVETGAAQAPLDRLSKQGTLIDVGKHFSHSGFRDPSCDAERFELPQHPPATVSLDLRFRACARERRAAIVQR